MPVAPPPNLPLQNDPAGDNFSGANIDSNNNPAPGEGLRPPETGKSLPLQGSTLVGEQASRVMPPEYRGSGGTRDPLLKVAQTAGPSVAPGAKKLFLSKKIIVVLIILIIAGAGIFVYFNWFVGNPVTDPEPMPPESNVAPAPLIPENENSAPSVNPVPADQDQDGDGLTDQEEEALGTNLKDSDSDLDGLPDGWEKDNGLNPLDPGDNKQDPDGDGLDNANEYYYHTNPFLADTDNDSYNDGAEVESGYDPAQSGGAKLETAAPIQEQQGASTSPSQRDKIRKNDLEALTIAMELYYEDHSLFPNSLNDLVPDYVIKLPQDPLSPRYNYQYQKTALAAYELAANLESDDDPEDLADGSLDHFYKIKVNGE